MTFNRLLRKALTIGASTGLIQKESEVTVKKIQPDTGAKEPQMTFYVAIPIMRRVGYTVPTQQCSQFSLMHYW